MESHFEYFNIGPFDCWVEGDYQDKERYRLVLTIKLGWTIYHKARFTLDESGDIRPYALQWAMTQCESWAKEIQTAIEQQGQRPRSAFDEYLTPPQIARLWKVRKETVINWIKTGRLKASNIGRKSRARFKIHRDDLEAFRRGVQVEKPTPAPRRKIPPPPRTYF